MPNSQRNPGADVRWGVSNGLGITAITLAPAFVVWLLNPDQEATATTLSFWQFSSLYLGFAAVAGAFAGVARPWLKIRAGTLVVGSVVGASGFFGLSFIPSSSASDPRMPWIMVILGCFAGAWLGWLIWRRENQR